MVAGVDDRLRERYFVTTKVVGAASRCDDRRAEEWFGVTLRSTRGRNEEY